MVFYTAYDKIWCMEKLKLVTFGAAPQMVDMFLAALGTDLYEAKMHQPPYDEKKVCDDLRDACVAVTWSGGPFLSRSILENAKELKFIQSMSVGYESVDLQAASDLGITVSNNPGFNAVSVAEHAMMAILVLIKRAFYGHQGMMQGKWLQDDLDSKIYELHGKTVGILGLGSIGTEVAKLLRPYQTRTLYNKRNRLPAERERELGVEYASFDQMLASSDVLTIHAPLTDETRGLFNADIISKMKNSAILVNTARKDIVDETALAEALRSGKLFGAAIDVPRSVEDREKVHELFRDAGNVLLTPHVASACVEMWPRFRAQLNDNLKRFHKGERPLYIVN